MMSRKSWNAPAGVALLAVLAFLPWPAAATDDLRYSNRGNRYEGSRELPIAGAPALEVLSFLRGSRSISPGANGQITLSFYLPAGAIVNIESRELVADRFYEMRPVRTKWDPGWNLFTPWSARDVLQPLGVRLDNLGVLASSPATTVTTVLKELVPIVPTGSASPDSRGTYYFFFRTRDDLRKADWSVRAASGSPDARQGSLRAVSGGAPAVIQFDLSGSPEGYYRVYVDCRYEGQAGGPEGEYRFYHRATFPRPGGGDG
jgi:hypothetical protein